MLSNIKGKIHNLKGLWIIVIIGLFSAGCQNTTFADLAEIINGSNIPTPSGDTAAPAAPVALVLDSADDSGSLNTDGITNQTSALTFTGTAEADSIVELWIDGNATGLSSVTTGGNFSIDIDLTAGATYTITAKATDASGNISAASTGVNVTIDNSITTPTSPDLAAADDLGSSNLDNMTAQTTGLTFSGTAEAGSSVQLYQNGIAIGFPVIATGGNYSVDVNLATSGTYLVSAVTTDPAGNVSAASTALNLILDTTLPGSYTAGSAGAVDPVLNAASDTGIAGYPSTFSDGITSVTTGLVLTGSLGTNNPGAIINVYVGGVLAGTATTDNAGNYSITTGAVNSGAVTFVITTPAGASSAPITAGTITIDTSAPVYSNGVAGAINPSLASASDSGASSTDNITNNTSPVFDGSLGSSNANAYIEIFVGATSLGLVQADTNGNYTFTPVAPIGSGSITFAVYDAAGNVTSTLNSGTVTIDSIAPTITSGILTPDNSSVTVNLSEAVYSSPAGGNSMNSGDLSLAFSNNSGNATGASISSVTHTAGNTSASVHLSITGTPSGVETVTITPANGTAIYDLAGNAMAGSQTTAALMLNDKLVPTVAITYNQSGNTVGPFSTGNVTITATYSEPVSTPNINIDQQGTTDIINVTMSGSGSVYTYTYNINNADASNYVDGTATISLTSVSDVSGNAASVPTNNTFTIFTGNLTFTTAVVAVNNASVTLDFNAPVYTTTGSSGALTASDFSLTFAANGGSATNATIASVTHTAGASSATLNLNVTGTPSGVETIEIKPASGASIYNALDAAMLATETTGTLTLKDQVIPTLSPVHIASNNTTTTLAKVGDTVTLTFTSSENISTPTVTIATNATLVSGGPTAWSATYTMASGDATGVLPFNIVFSDSAGNAGTAVTSTTDASSVTFDKTAPTLSPVHISSNNATTTFAKVGDTVTLTFTSSENTSTPTVTIATNAASVSGGPTAWSATYTMASGDTPGAVPFSIAYSDPAGNAGTTVTSTTDASSVTFDKTAPTLSPVHVASNNAVTTLAKVGDTVTLTFTSSENTSTPTVTIATNAASVSGGPTAWSATYTMASGDATGTVPFNISFSDLAGNAGSAVSTTTDASSIIFDKTLPTITGGIVASDNTNVTVTFSEAVYTGTGSSGSLTSTDFGISFAANGGSATNATIASVTHTAGNSTAIVNLSITGTPNGLETVTITPANGTSIYDYVSNAMAGTQTTGALALKDQVLPTITNGTVAADNSSVTVAFSEGVYTTTGASGVLTSGDFSINFAANGGDATGASISSVTHTAGSASATVYLSITGTPSGTETVTITPASGAAIYDGGDNAMAGTQTTGALSLYDQKLPSVTTAETMDSNGNGKIDHYKITFSESISDSTFPGYTPNALGSVTTDWLVAGYTNVKLAHGTAAPVSDTINDNIVYINFSESGSFDTASKPNLTTTVTPGVTDTIGNVIAQIGTGTVTEADRAIPIVVSATGTDNTAVNVVFSEAMQATTAQVIGQYTITGAGGLNVLSAVMSGGSGVDGTTVILTTDAQTAGTNNYTVTVGTSVLDINNNAVSAVSGNSALFSGQPSLFKVLSAAALDNTHITVTFNHNIGTGGTTAGNYSIGGGSLAVTNASVTGAVATLTTASQTSNTLNGYTIVVTNVYDTQPALVDAAFDSATFTGDTLPAITNAVSADMNNVQVTFSEQVDWSTTGTGTGTGIGALNSGNYCIELQSDGTPQVCDNPALGTITVSSVIAGTKVNLAHTTGQNGNDLYRVTVLNVADITTPTPNTIDTTANTANFTGLENMKVLTAAEISGTAPAFRILSMTFSKSFKTGGGVNAADNISLSTVGGIGGNYQAASGTRILGICLSTDDAACPATGIANGNTTIYIKVDDGAGAKPAQGNYTFTAAGKISGGAYSFGSTCILPNVTGLEVDPADCLQGNPNDRATIAFGALPTNPGDGPVYSDPFNDGTTLSGQAFVYNNKLMIGPNSGDSGIFQTDINMQNSTTITLDADNVTLGSQAFPSVWEHCTVGTWPNCTAGVMLGGIDRFYTGCYDSTAPYVNSSLTGSACSTGGGTEYLFVLGYVTPTTTTGAYQSQWNTTSTTSPFIFAHHSAPAFNNSSYRSFSLAVFNGKVYQATGHQGSTMVRWSQTDPLVPGNNVDLTGEWLTRMGCSGTLQNGNCNTANTDLISIDTMYEHDNDGIGIGNDSQLYIANGGSCTGTCLTTGAAGTDRVNTTQWVDGGVLRSVIPYVLPTTCTSAANCNAKWQDVTPLNSTWLRFMSISLPKDAVGNGVCGTVTIGQTEDWDCLLPSNTITPAIKAVPGMVTFNGDLYMIRNSCASITVNTLSSTIHKTCPAGSERPQLWRLPALPDTTLPLPAACVNSTDASAACARARWQFIGNGTSFMTQMAGASWAGGLGTCTDVSAGGSHNQATCTGNNTEIVLLEVVGNRLYVGFDNAINGINLWRTQSGKTNPISETEFEAVCDTGLSCADPAKQFGFGTIWDGVATNDVSRIFGAVSVNDAGTDYLVVNAGDGVNPVKVYRENNN